MASSRSGLDHIVGKVEKWTDMRRIAPRESCRPCPVAGTVRNLRWALGYGSLIALTCPVGPKARGCPSSGLHFFCRPLASATAIPSTSPVFALHQDRLDGQISTNSGGRSQAAHRYGLTPGLRPGFAVFSAVFWRVLKKPRFREKPLENRSRISRR